MIAPVEAAELCCAAYRMFDPDNMAPALDAEIYGRWYLLGHVLGKDALFDGQQFGLGEDTWYGFVARRRPVGETVVVLRGTKTPVEWLEDLEADLISNVELGFWSIYKTLHSTCDLPHAVTFVGHSLGSALAAYWCLDAAKAGHIASGVFLASPKPGDGYFAAEFDTQGIDYQVINYLRDIVPRLPLTIPLLVDFQPLHKVRWIRPSESTAMIPDNIRSNHAADSYLDLLQHIEIPA